MPAAPLDRRDVVLATIVGAAAVAVFVPIQLRWLSLLDEGYVLAIADQINRGRALYRDIWIDNPFPGAFELLAAWFRLTGPSVASSRLLALGGFGIYAAASYLVARSLLDRAGALAYMGFILCWRLWAFPHWQVYGYSLPAAVAVQLAWVVALPAARRGTASLWVVSGAWLGAATLCKQSYGLAVAATTSLVLVALAFVDPPGRPSLPRVVRGPLLLGCGVALVVAPVIARLAWTGALHDFIQQTVLQPVRGATTFGAYVRLPPIWPLHRQDPVLRESIGAYFPAILATLWWPRIGTSWWMRETPVWDAGLKLVYWAPIGLFCVGAAIFGAAALRDLRRRRADPRHAPRLLALAVAGAYLLAFPPPRDWTHLMMVVPAPVLIGCALLRDLGRRSPAAVRSAFVVGVGGVLALLIVVSTLLAADLRRTMDVPVDGARAGVTADPQNGPILRAVLDHVAARVPAGAPLPVYPTQPMIGFLSAHEPPAAFHVIWPVQDEGRDARIIAAFEQERPPLVIYSLSQYSHLGRFQDNAPALFAYLVDHFAIERVFSDELNGPLLVALAPRSAPARPVGEDDLQGGRWVQWPFAHVLAPVVGLPGSAEPARLRIDPVPEGTRIALAYGVNPDRWLWLRPGPFRFTVTATTAGRSQTLLDRTIDPARNVADRRWHQAIVDLGPLAASGGDLLLAVEAEGLAEGGDDLAGFADLQFVGPEREGNCR